MTININQIQLRLADLIRQSKPGDSIIIEDHGSQVAEVLVKSPPAKVRCFGFLKGQIRFVGDENDKSHMDDFKEYM